MKPNDLLTGVTRPAGLVSLITGWLVRVDRNLTKMNQFFLVRFGFWLIRFQKNLFGF